MQQRVAAGNHVQVSPIRHRPRTARIGVGHPSARRDGIVEQCVTVSSRKLAVAQQFGENARRDRSCSSAPIPQR